jgi:hypothetical protein
VVKSSSRMYVSSKKHWSGRRWLNNTIANKQHNTTIYHFETLTIGEFIYIFSFFCPIHVTNHYLFCHKKRLDKRFLIRIKNWSRQIMLLESNVLMLTWVHITRKKRIIRSFVVYVKGALLSSLDVFLMHF